MAEPKLEAVAWRARQRNTAPDGESTPWEYGESLPAPERREWMGGGIVREVELLAPLLIAQALLAERGERIAELEGRLTRLLPIARAAVQWTTAEKDLDAAADGEQVIAAKRALWGAEDAIHAAVAALTPEQRAEILESAETGGLSR